MSKILAKELKACKADLVRFYDLQKKSGLYPHGLITRRLHSIDSAIEIIQGEKDKPGIQNTLF
jgi:hypothetical protein